MSKFLTILLTLAVTLFSVTALAQSVPPSPAPTSWISDTSGVLSVDAHARLDAKLKQINQSSANEIAALVVPTLSGGNIEDLTNATFKAWGVGKKDLDNGVLVVLAMKEHKSRIETGKGVEGDLPDLKTQDILQAARPWLRKGDVEGALGFIFDSSASAIANHKVEAAKLAANPPAPGTSTSSGGASCDASTPGAFHGTNWFLMVGSGLVLLAVLWASVSGSRQKREEKRLADLKQETERLRAEQAERRRLATLARERRAAELAIPSPFVTTSVEATLPPVVSRAYAPLPAVYPKPVAPNPVIGTAAAATVIAAAAELERQREEETARHRRAEADRKRRKRRQRDEEDERRRRRDSESSSSSSSDDSGSSSSSWDSGGSSGDFGGGDSGGGGSSSDW